MTGARIREPMPVEALLQWAYGQQMVHLAQRSAIVSRAGGGPLAAYSALWSDGATPIDSSADQGFRASDDAWAIHDLVQELRPVTLDLGQDLAAARYHALGQYRGAEPPVTRSAPAFQSVWGWPTDGLLKIDVRAQVMVHASRGTRPDFAEPAVWRMKPVHKGMVRHPKLRGGVYRLGWYHHVEIDGVTPGEMAEVAAIYGAWWSALDRLRQRLGTIRLTMFTVTNAMPQKIQADRLIK